MKARKILFQETKEKSFEGNDGVANKNLPRKVGLKEPFPIGIHRPGGRHDEEKGIGVTVRSVLAKKVAKEKIGFSTAGGSMQQSDHYFIDNKHLPCKQGRSV